MKIEIGESIMYSWMRHVKDCKIVQTNWKSSTLWDPSHDDEVESYMNEFADLFKKEKDFDVFKKNASSEQFINQGECDVIGVNLSVSERKVYAADVAFHRNGLNYKETVQKVVEKCIRTALCIYIYTDMKDAEIVFASPKIGPKNLDNILYCIKLVQDKFDNWGFNYKFDIIANQDFHDKILEPVCAASKKVDDTNELFLRAYQLYEMFYDVQNDDVKKSKTSRKTTTPMPVYVSSVNTSMSVFKIGKLAQVYFSKLAMEGRISPADVSDLLKLDYSHKNLGLNFSCLVTSRTGIEERYYKNPIEINGKDYYLCSQWFETSANNDRPLLEAWILARL